MWDKPAVCNNIGALSYHMVDFQNVLRDLFTKGHISKVEIEEISNWYIERDTNRQPNKFTGIAKGKNLIIIQVESLQEFVIDLKINGKEVTPNLNKFVKKSLYFPRTYNQTSVGNSSDAEFIVNTGLYPAESGVAYTRFATNEYHSLPFLLTEKGYNVLALHGDREGFWNRHKMYPALGFNKFISKKDFIVDENIGMGLSDRSFFSQSIEKMKKEKEPFYAFLITLTSHYPFDFPELLQQSDLDVTGLDDCLLTNYLKGMRYFDNHFGDFVKKLEEEGFTENSLIVIYGDHTAIPKGETSRLEKILNKELREDVQWKDFQRIPLIIKLPDSISKSNVLNTTTGQIDVSATVANLLGYSYKAGMGNDLFSKEKNVPLIFRNGTYILDCSYIEPSQMKSTSINSNKELKYTNFKKISYKVKKELSYSDKILEYNLMKKLKYSK
ncbi:MAG: LTA synthase family protein [Synergistaceae bacterium]